MQGQRSIINSAPEALEFERGSTSSNTNVERRGFWTEMLNHPFESHLLLSPGDDNVTFSHAISQEGRTLSGWNSGEPGSSQNPGNQFLNGEAKTEHGWLSSMTANQGAGPRLGEQDYQPTNTLSLGNINMNDNTNRVADGPSFLQNSGSVNIPQNVSLNLGYAGNDGSQNVSLNLGYAGNNGSQNVEAGISTQQYKSGGPGSEHIASDGSSVDGRRASCKRKALEGISAQSSIGASSSNSQRAESSVQNGAPAGNTTSDSLTLSAPRENQSAVGPHELLDPRLGGGNRRQASDSHLAVPVEENESSQRNYRMRTNPSYQQDPVQSNLSLTGNTVRGSSIWPSHQVPSGFTQFSQSLDAGPRAFNASTPPNPNGLLRNAQLNPWNETSDSRVGSSSSSPVSAAERPSMIEQDNSRHMPINGPALPVYVRAMRGQSTGPRRWGIADVDRSISENIRSASPDVSGVPFHPSHPPARVHRPIPPSQSRQVILASAAASGSEPGGQSHNFPIQHVDLASSQQMAFSSGAGSQGSPQPGRHPNWSGVLPSIRISGGGRDGRSRIISEIRNALDNMRRNGEHLMFEELLALNPLILNGVALLQDRHRDMRLDVDNMSYEELLALEEQMGNVSTGLTEETVMKFLKQRNFSSERMGTPENNEPCCICQEEFVEDERLGALDCGHNFHTVCITKWLMEKNLCPVCKTTALVTGDQAS